MKRQISIQPNRIDYSGTDGSTQFQSFLYDETGALKEANDNGIVTRYNYQSGSYMPNPFDLTRSVSETVNGDTKEMAYAYDVMQRMVEVTHSNSSQVEYLYNSLGQLERIPGYIDQPMEFADTGLLAGYTLANGAAASFAYDDKYRVKSISHNDAFGDEALAYNFRYDKADNLLQRNQEFFSYDRKGQLLSAALTGEAAATEYELDAIPQTGEARNDVLGSRELVIPGENLTIDWGAGSVGIDLGYAYKVKRFTIGAAETALPLNKETLAIYSSVYNAEGAFKEEKFSLSEDSSEGNITIELEEAVFARFLKIHSHVNPLNAEGSAIKDEGVFTLDTDAVTVTALTGGRNEFYRYRKDGNREAVTIMADDFDTSPYSYYPGGDLIKTAGAYAFVYDANGNLRERGNVYTMSGEIPRIEKSGDYIKYEYDLLNRLVAVERLNDEGDLVTVARYRYNANGLRVLRTDSEGQETRYVFDLDGNVIEEHTGGEVTRYVFRKNKHLARVSNEGTFFYGTDNLGSTVVITDETGATVWKGDVSPFGDRTTGDGSIEAQVKYTGKDMDEETGLYYFNARWYDPVLGRFTSEDPARDGANWFVYVNNNPLKWVDPSGLDNKLAEVILRTLTSPNMYLDGTTDSGSNRISLQSPKFVNPPPAKEQIQKNFFKDIVSLFSGRTYGGAGSHYGYNKLWDNPSDNLVCTSFAESIMRVYTAGSISELINNDRNALSGREIFEGFGAKQVSKDGRDAFLPSELVSLDKDIVYGLSIYKKEFTKEGWDTSDPSRVIEYGDDSFGTFHVGFMMSDEESGKWQLIHQDRGKNVVNFDETEYADDDTYRMVVFEVTGDADDREE